MKAGALRHRVSLQAPATVQDPDTGETVSTWGEVASVWAFVRYVSAREFRQSAADQTQATGDMTIRFRSDVLPTWRAVHRGRVLNLGAALPDDGSGLEYLTIPFTEGANDGE